MASARRRACSAIVQLYSGVSSLHSVCCCLQANRRYATGMRARISKRRGRNPNPNPKHGTPRHGTQHGTLLFSIKRLSLIISDLCLIRALRQRSHIKRSSSQPGTRARTLTTHTQAHMHLHGSRIYLQAGSPPAIVQLMTRSQCDNAGRPLSRCLLPLP